MVYLTSSDKLEIFDEPVFDKSLVSIHEHTYRPYGSPYYRNSDIIHIPINFQDLILDVSDSYIFIEGKFTPKDNTKSCFLSNNAFAFLFDEIRYYMGGEQVVVVRNPGITSTMKTCASYGKNNKLALLPTGWGLGATAQDVWDHTSNVFSGKLPLKLLMGFAEDYNKVILNVKQELVLVIARTFTNCYVGEVDADIEITKLEWKIKHIIPEDRQKLKLLNRLNKTTLNSHIKIPYRQWDLYELPSLRKTSSDIWAIKTTNSLERPRYVVIGFQEADASDNRENYVTKFINADINSIRLSLNNEVYPYERWNLDFKKKLYAPAYYTFENFQRSYYGTSTPDLMMDLGDFFTNPLFVIDCFHQPDSLKLSTVDIKLEFETREKKFPNNTKVYALIIHDSFISYNPLDGSVHTGLVHGF